jgi:hypothetical protein
MTGDEADEKSKVEAENLEEAIAAGSGRPETMVTPRAQRPQITAVVASDWGARCEGTSTTLE